MGNTEYCGDHLACPVSPGFFTLSVFSLKTCLSRLAPNAFTEETSLLKKMSDLRSKNNLNRCKRGLSWGMGCLSPGAAVSGRLQLSVGRVSRPSSFF